MFRRAKRFPGTERRAKAMIINTSANNPKEEDEMETGLPAERGIHDTAAGKKVFRIKKISASKPERDRAPVKRRTSLLSRAASLMSKKTTRRQESDRKLQVKFS